MKTSGDLSWVLLQVLVPFYMLNCNYLSWSILNVGVLWFFYSKQTPK